MLPSTSRVEQIWIPKMPVSVAAAVCVLSKTFNQAVRRTHPKFKEAADYWQNRLPFP